MENDEKHLHEIDATDSVAGLIIRRNPDRPEMLMCDAWACGLSKRAAANVLRQIAESWETDALLESGLN